MTFLHEIFDTYDSRINFLKGCIRLAKSDGHICEEEQDFILNAAKALNIDDDSQKRLFLLMNERVENIDVNFTNRKQKLIFLKEAIHLCYSDGIFADVERDQVEAIAKEMNISLYAVNEIDRWVVKGMDLAKEGQKLLDTLE